jgi:hypothetical protein
MVFKCVMIFSHCSQRELNGLISQAQCKMLSSFNVFIRKTSGIVWHRGLGFGDFPKRGGEKGLQWHLNTQLWRFDASLTRFHQRPDARTLPNAEGFPRHNEHDIAIESGASRIDKRRCGVLLVLIP